MGRQLKEKQCTKSHHRRRFPRRHESQYLSQNQAHPMGLVDWFKRKLCEASGEGYIPCLQTRSVWFQYLIILEQMEKFENGR